jgi:hypothetical protein
MFELIFLMVIIAVIVRAIKRAKTATGGLFGGLPPRGGLFGGGRELEGLFQLMEQQIRNYQNLPTEQRWVRDAHMAAMWLKLSNQMRSLDAHHRAMYEARAGDIASYAAQNGIDVKPPSW